MIDLAARRTLILEAASRAGTLVNVSLIAAHYWQTEWRRTMAGIVKAYKVRPPRAPRPVGQRRCQPSRRVDLPMEFTIPGTWVRYRTRKTSAPLIFQVVAYVPAGADLSHCLTPEQMAILDRHACCAPTPRFARVVLGVPGNRRAFQSLRPTLAGALAARGEVLDGPPGQAMASSRLSSPLEPGVEASWSWHSSHGSSPTHHGEVLAYVPAGVALSSISPGIHLSSDMHDVSAQDRYLVRVRGKRVFRLKTPAAHLVERGLIPEPLP